MRVSDESRCDARFFTLGQPRREIALAGVGQDDDDELPCVLGPFRDDESSCEGGSTRDSREDSFLAGETACCVEGFVAGDRDDLVDEFRPEDVRDESRPDSLYLVGGVNWFLALQGAFDLRRGIRST